MVCLDYLDQHFLLFVLNQNMLSFVFTEDSFRIDHPGEDVAAEEQALKEAFLQDRYKALFQLGFQVKKRAESPSLAFLHGLARRYLRALTNLPDLEVARNLIRSGCFKAAEVLYDSVPDLLSQLIRTAFIPASGKLFAVADYSAIEARVVAWLAGEDGLTEGEEKRCSAKNAERSCFPTRAFARAAERPLRPRKAALNGRPS